MVNVNVPPSTQTKFEHTILNWAGFSYFAKRILAPGPPRVFGMFQRVLGVLT